jgi:histidinol-phosphatase (PHP family)
MPILILKDRRRSIFVSGAITFVDDVLRVADRYYPEGLSVKLGIEIGWFRGCEKLVERLKARYNFDYVMCGIHELDNICFCCQHSYERCFSRYSPHQVAEKYFADVQQAAATGLFDSIAHLTYYLRAGLDYYGKAVREVHRPYLQETLKTLADHNTGIEVNTSALRHGLKQYYPPMDIINSARKAGVFVNYLGSDAHRPDQVGFDFEAAVALDPDILRGCEE